MSHSITVNQFEFEPSRAEKILYATLKFVVGFPVAVLRTTLFVLIVRFVNYLLRRVRTTYLKAHWTSKDKKVITDVHPGLVDLLRELEGYHSSLRRVQLPRIFFLDSAVSELGYLIEDFKDLELAYSIFLEPAERDYPVTREFAILRNGRKNHFYSLPDQSSSNGQSIPESQIVLPVSED